MVATSAEWLRVASDVAQSSRDINPENLKGAVHNQELDALQS
jgi:hypothetical protein